MHRARRSPQFATEYAEQVEKMRYACNLHLLTEVFFSFFFFYLCSCSCSWVAFPMRVMPPFGICHVWHVRATWTHAATSISCPAPLTLLFSGHFSVGSSALVSQAVSTMGLLQFPFPKFRPHLREELS